jgi:phosphate:Na+ symporter
VKRIYSEIISFAVHAQSDLSLSEAQHNRIMELKFAGRRMVEIIKDANELNRNITQFLREPHPVMMKEYNHYRKKIVKILRIINEFEKEDNSGKFEEKLEAYALEASESRGIENERIDRYIRENAVTPEMGSSLVNDHDILNDLIQNLIIVAELLNSNKDVIQMKGYTGMDFEKR